MKNYSILSCFLALSLSVFSAFAQLSVGVQGGYVKNYLNTSTGYLVSTQYAPATGFSIGIPIRYSVNKWLAFQVEPQLIQKNYRLNRTGSLDGLYQTTTNQYLQLPIMGHFSFGGARLKGFMNLGGYAGYWATSTNQGALFAFSPQLEDETDESDALPDYLLQKFNESYTFDGRKDRRLEIGLLAGTGIGYQAGRYNFFVEGRYYYALSDQQKNYMINQIPRYNQTYALQVGCLYQLTLR
ncbi:porin family protein [Spirosoma validum]|uniref:PorT family protein n=1 Tax=Spirosoma validum TaxID=2771355 RepID=A0A927B6F3_9BACT|nr:porin family protein [Spirosoma validum]MBD2756574.1 PorT family protein [Spirosoma validum]